MDLQALALAPPILVIILAIMTRKVIPSLFIGLWLGASMLSRWNPVLGFLKIFNSYIIPSLGSPWNATIIIYGSAFGGLLAILQRSGGAYAIGEYFTNKIRCSSKIAQFYTMLLGLLIFFDDYFSCLTAGITMRPISDRLKISREKLAFIVDSTAAPICLLVPLSTWVIYIVGILGQELPLYNLDTTPYLIYIKTIPLNFYAWSALLATAFFSLTKYKFGPMKKAENRALKTGKLHRDSSRLPISSELDEIIPTKDHAKISDLIIPLAVLMTMFPIMFLYTGGFFNENSGNIMAAIREAQGPFSVLISAIIAGATAFILGLSRKQFNFEKGFNTYIDGMKGMLPTYLILIMAWGTASMIKDLGAALYLSQIVSSKLPGHLIPLILFLLSASVAFTSGTSYGTFAILIPLAIPLTFDANLPIETVIAPILSGGIFGDHCSPISDTTILSSTGAACNTIDHVTTQLPYALTAASAASLGFIVHTFTNNNILALTTTAILFLSLAITFSKFSGDHREQA